MYGSPDEDLCERVHAAVVLKSGAAPSPQELICYCRDRLAPYKCPKKIVPLPVLPRNAMGKIQKQDLPNK